MLPAGKTFPAISVGMPTSFDMHCNVSQVKSLQTGNCPKCPYCKADFAIYYHGKNTPEQAIHNRLEEQQQAEAAARSRQVRVDNALWLSFSARVTKYFHMEPAQ